MDEDLQIARRPWLHPDALAQLIDGLRDAGHNIGVAQYLAAQNLLVALVAAGETLDDPRRLKGLLGPLLCGSPSEQEAFGTRFDDWMARWSSETESPDAESGRRARLQAELQRTNRGRRVTAWAVVLLVLAVIAVVAWLEFSTTETATTQSTGSSARRQNVPAPSPSPSPQSPSWSLVWFLLPVPILAVLARRIWLRRQARLFLERRRTRDNPERTPIPLGGVPDNLHPVVLLSRIAQNFRRRVDVPSNELDASATVRATLRRGGWLTPVFGRRQVVPEYLVLFDRVSRSDHQARTIQELLRHLSQNQVLVSAYQFSGDPRTCEALPEFGAHRPTARSAQPAGRPVKSLPVSLGELAARHGQDRLILVTDGRGLVSPRTGELHPWIDLLRPWKERMLLTSQAEEHWSDHEETLARMFTVVPATTEGLRRLSRRLRSREAAIAAQPTGRPPLPEELVFQPRRWLAQDAPGEASLEAMLQALRQHLGREGYFWLSACAIYPELDWNLTVALGQRLLDEQQRPLLESRRLLALARLPWFRHGSMPDWLRLRLIAELSRRQERAIRSLLSALMLEGVAGAADPFTLTIVREYQGAVRALMRPLLNLLGRGAPRGSPFRDLVFLRFMSGRRAQPLAVRLPQALREFLFPRKPHHAWATWSRWVVWECVGWLAMLGLGAAAIAIGRSLSIGWSEISAMLGLGAAAIAIGLEDESLLHTAGLSLLLGLGLGTARAFGFGPPRWLETLKWIGVTSAVLFGAFVLLVRTEVKADTWTSGLWWGLAVGVCLGLSQLFVLPRGCRYKLAWPIANGVAMAVVFSILGGNGDVIFSGPGPGILAMTGFGAASGAITGLALMVMREPSYRVFQAWRALRDFFLSTAPESDLALARRSGTAEAIAWLLATIGLIVSLTSIINDTLRQLDDRILIPIYLAGPAGLLSAGRSFCFGFTTWRRVLGWAALGALGCGLAGVALNALDDSGALGKFSSTMTWCLGGAAFGALLGISHMFVLPPAYGRRYLWVLHGTVTGSGIGLIVRALNETLIFADQAKFLGLLFLAMVPLSILFGGLMGGMLVLMRRGAAQKPAAE